MPRGFLRLAALRCACSLTEGAENRVMGPFARIPVQCSSEDFEALEEVWRRRVESARDRYVEALSQTRAGTPSQAQLIRREALARTGVYCDTSPSW